MKVLFKAVWLVIIVLVFLSCKDKDNEVPKTYLIQYGTECGWCAGQEYITLSYREIKYERDIPCGENKGITNKSKPLSSDEWSTIIESFDYGLFKTLEYTDCNVCVDGCDEIIKITDGDFAHELRYSVSDEVEGMAKLRGILSVIMDEMRVAN